MLKVLGGVMGGDSSVWVVSCHRMASSVTAVTSRMLLSALLGTVQISRVSADALHTQPISSSGVCWISGRCEESADVACNLTASSTDRSLP